MTTPMLNVTGSSYQEWFWWINNEHKETERNRRVMFDYKRHKCSNSEPHDITLCFGWHDEEHYARSPYVFIPKPCPEFRKTKGICKKGNSCPLAHGIVEIGTHPSRFCTEKWCVCMCCMRIYTPC